MAIEPNITQPIQPPMQPPNPFSQASPEDMALAMQDAMAPQGVKSTPEMLDTQGQLRAIHEKQQLARTEQLADLTRLKMATIKDRPAQGMAELLGGIDMITGSKLSQSYQPATTQRDHQKDIASLDKLIQSQKNSMSKDQMSFLNKQLQMQKQEAIAGSREERLALSAKSLKEREDKHGEIQTAKHELGIRNYFTKEFSEYSATRNTMDNIEAAVNSGDFSGIEMIKSLFARAVGGEKGVLTEKDIRRVMPLNLQGTLAQMKSYFSKVPSAQMRPEYTRALSRALSAARANLKKMYKERVNRQVEGSKRSKSLGKYYDENTEGEYLHTNFLERLEVDSPTDPRVLKMEALIDEFKGSKKQSDIDNIKRARQAIDKIQFPPVDYE